MNFLYEHGPSVRKAICDGIGMRWKNGSSGRGSMYCNGAGNGGSYLAHLVRLGLVQRMKRVVRTGRRGGNVDLYALPLWVEKLGTG